MKRKSRISIIIVISKAARFSIKLRTRVPVVQKYQRGEKGEKRSIDDAKVRELKGTSTTNSAFRESFV